MESFCKLDNLDNPFLMNFSSNSGALSIISKFPEKPNTYYIIFVPLKRHLF